MNGLFLKLLFYVFLNSLRQRLQDQDRRNHEAYIRSGEIFEDRQQAYEKMTKGYEKLLASCQTYVLATRIRPVFRLPPHSNCPSFFISLCPPSLLRPKKLTQSSLGRITLATLEMTRMKY